MRADRLLSLLMLLQHRGKLTARELAQELEVTERTIYRDVSALCSAGIPVYSEAGPSGGYSLVERYRTTLTGLSEPEIRALFMLNIPVTLSELGIDQDARAAMLKLAAALPESRRVDEQAVRQRYYLDAVWWEHSGVRTPHLKTIYQAVWSDACLEIAYPSFAGIIDHLVVEPYGLVAKAGAWYLVSRLPGSLPGTERVYQVSKLMEAKPTEVRFDRDPRFNLAAFWQGWCARVSAGQHQYKVQARVSPAILPYLEHYLATPALVSEPPANAQGEWPELTLAFESLHQARERLLALGAAVEVLAPLPLRLSMADLAGQILKKYT